ncbi:MAG: hypothetical protein ACM3QW_02050 [Ignavibacteriales bacterium]
MESLLLAADVLTSDRLYTKMMTVANQLAGFVDALILVPGDNDDNLMLVEVYGKLPERLTFPGIKHRLDELEGPVADLPSDIPELSNYQHVVKFESNGSGPTAYMVFSGSMPEVTKGLLNGINTVANLLGMKKTLETISTYEQIESKLKYQLTFLSNAINNIFEPFGTDTLVQLSMEIISEMFIFPSAAALVLQNGQLVPRFFKGNKKETKDLTLDAQPFLTNRSSRIFPTDLSTTNVEMVGKENALLLASHHAQLLVPLTISEKLYALVVCIKPGESALNFQDHLVLGALGNILNRALELSETRLSLTTTNLQLDRKVFALTTVYNAAQKIFSKLNLSDTGEMVLDMLTEIFQSSISSVVFLNRAQNRYDLLKVKSAFRYEALSYCFTGPDSADGISPITRYRDDLQERDAFLHMFPEFADIEDRLAPEIIAHLYQQDRYYGFITLSDRVTGQTYSDEDLELLQLLLNSTLSALDNAWLYDELQTKKDQLDRKILDSYAIQDVIKLVRRADSLEEFLSLLTLTLEMGAGVEGLGLLGRSGDELVLLHGATPLTPDITRSLLETKEAEILDFNDKEGLSRMLVIPLMTTDVVAGYLTVEGFNDTILEDADRIRLLTVISVILSDRFAELEERSAWIKNGISDYPSLIWYTLNREIQTLRDYGLPVSIIKFTHPDPVQLIASLNATGRGFVISPSTGILVSHLPEKMLRQQIAGQNFKFKFVRHWSKDNIFQMRV